MECMSAFLCELIYRFLCVELQLRSIDSHRVKTRNLIRTIVEHPALSMNDEYNRIFDQISRLPEHDRKLAKHIFMWMTYAFRPLTLEEVEYVFTIEWERFRLNPDDFPSNPKQLLLICGNLVVCEEKKIWQSGSVLSFVHASVKDYLRSKGHEIETNPRMQLSSLFTGEIEAHNVLAKTSITYLHFVGLFLAQTQGSGRNDTSGSPTDSYHMVSEFSSSTWRCLGRILPSIRP